jgi:hypothetical protein
MANKKTKSPLKDWEETINKMSYAKLQRYIADPEICYPEFLVLAKNRLRELEETRDSVNYLKEYIQNKLWDIIYNIIADYYMEEDAN